MTNDQNERANEDGPIFSAQRVSKGKRRKRDKTSSPNIPDIEYVYLVIRDTYGATSLPKGVWIDRPDAIEQAIRLSGGEEFDERESGGYRMEGQAQSGTCAWQVYKYRVDAIDGTSIDHRDNGAI